VQEKPIKIAVGPLFYQNSTIDVAVFKADNVHPMIPYVPLGGHLGIR
jgi:hypothetical protein